PILMYPREVPLGRNTARPWSQVRSMWTQTFPRPSVAIPLGMDTCAKRQVWARAVSVRDNERAAAKRAKRLKLVTKQPRRSLGPLTGRLQDRRFNQLFIAFSFLVVGHDPPGGSIRGPASGNAWLSAPAAA